MINLSAANLKPAIERLMNSLDPFSEKLIQAGWTINMNMAPFQIIEISESIDTVDIDDYFYSYFMDNYQDGFIFLKNNCMEKLNVRLTKAFEECVFAFNNQKYIICANTLLVILEGVLSKYIIDKRNTHMIRPYREKFEQIPEEQEINKAIWYVNLKFIEQLYCKSDFNNAEPLKMNRNWLLHGRSAFDIKEMDCLRLFNAIGTICDSYGECSD